jgi:biopolymer transport protein ExbD
MNFLRRPVDEPEINLIPLVDVLLVILIFLMVTTSWSRHAELRIDLPRADADKAPQRPEVIDLVILSSGRFQVDGSVLDAGADANQLATALRQARGQRRDPVVVIQGDRNASLQAAVTAMEASRIAGLAQVTFSTQAGPGR